MPFRDRPRVEPEFFHPDKHIEDGVGPHGSFVRKSALENDQKAIEEADEINIDQMSMDEIIKSQEKKPFLNKIFSRNKSSNSDAIRVVPDIKPNDIVHKQAILEDEQRDRNAALEKIGGVYPLEDEMAFAPDDIEGFDPHRGSFGSYGRAEREAAASLIIAICRDLHAWKGISYSRFAAELKHRTQSSREIFKKTGEKIREKMGHASGVYFEDEMSVDDATNFSELFQKRGGNVSQGLYELLQMGMVEIRAINGEEVLFPTPAFLPPLESNMKYIRFQKNERKKSIEEKRVVLKNKKIPT